MVTVLFVCVANICRSPTLEAVLKHLAVQKDLSDKLYVDSCGVGWVCPGQSPDPRSFLEAKKRGIHLDHKAQQFEDHFFKVFDYIFAVDEEILEQLKAKTSDPSKIYLATAFGKRFKNQKISDPYNMGKDGFSLAMDVMIDACEGILQKLFKTG